MKSRTLSSKNILVRVPTLALKILEGFKMTRVTMLHKILQAFLGLYNHKLKNICTHQKIQFSTISKNI